MLKSSLYDFSDAQIAVKGTITFPNAGTVAANKIINKDIVFKKSAPFPGFISEINTLKAIHKQIMLRTLMQ